MKINTVRVFAVACTLLSASLAGAANIILGTGPDVSYLVLESPNIGSRTYEIYYTYSTGSPLDTWGLLQIVDSAESDLSISAGNFGTAQEPNYFISAITWLGVTETTTGAPTYAPYWVQSVAGGLAGYPTGVPVAEGSWSEGSGVSAPFREIAPGSWDGLVYGAYGDVPSVNPVPEPVASVMVFMGSALLLLRRRAR